MLLVLVLGVSVVAGCERPAGPAPETTAATPVSMPRLTELMISVLPASALVFVGEVVSVGRPPGVWSGDVQFFQEVTYRVTKVLRGDASKPGELVVVRHLVVADSATADHDVPQLLPGLFNPGASLLVLAHDEPQRETHATRWTSANEQYGVAAATPALVDALERAIAP